MAESPCTSRRHFLTAQTMGISGVALASLLRDQGLLAEPIKPPLVTPSYNLEPKPSHNPPRATAMISLFMQGGPSQMDLTDPKPRLNALDGKKFPGKIKYDNAAQASAKVLGSPWKFKKRGQCGTELSELLPHLATVIDEITLIRSMVTGVNNHGQSIYALNCGTTNAGRPTLGSWLTYGLGAVTQNLPAYMALPDPKGLPVVGVKNWSNGWLPSIYQGTVVRPREPRILNLVPPAHLQGKVQEDYLAYLNQLNQQHLAERPNESDLAARIAGYKLAARMQIAATEALDVSKESEATKKLYGLDQAVTAEYGTRCLIARRLVERGVRFVQVFTRNQFWDHHGNIRSSLPNACRMTDQPAAALIKDLKSRGLLDTTLVHWGGEMGRLPVVQNDVGANKVGRDHNTYGFSMWLAGGGTKGGFVLGETDEFGHHAIVDKVTHHDYHATLLHLFGLDHRKLTYKQNGGERSLVDNQSCRIVKELLA